MLSKVIAALILCMFCPALALAEQSVRKIEIVSKSSLQIETMKQQLKAAGVAKAAELPRETLDAVTMNPEIREVLSAGWEKVRFTGVGEVLMKQRGGRTLIKLPRTLAIQAMPTIAASVKTLLNCGDDQVCISFDNSVVDDKSASREVR